MDLTRVTFEKICQYKGVVAVETQRKAVEAIGPKRKIYTKGNKDNKKERKNV